MATGDPPGRSRPGRDQAARIRGARAQRDGPELAIHADAGRSVDGGGGVVGSRETRGLQTDGHARPGRSSDTSSQDARPTGADAACRHPVTLVGSRRSRAHAPVSGVPQRSARLRGCHVSQVKAWQHGAQRAGGCQRGLEPRWTPGLAERELVASRPGCPASVRGVRQRVRGLGFAGWRLVRRARAERADLTAHRTCLSRARSAPSQRAQRTRSRRTAR
jgi:hypothetical protein